VLQQDVNLKQNRTQGEIQIYESIVRQIDGIDSTKLSRMRWCDRLVRWDKTLKSWIGELFRFSSLHCESSWKHAVIWIHFYQFKQAGTIDSPIRNNKANNRSSQEQKWSTEYYCIKWGSNFNAFGLRQGWSAIQYDPESKSEMTTRVKTVDRSELLLHVV